MPAGSSLMKVQNINEDFQNSTAKIIDERNTKGGELMK
jgi:hypothetical protein